MNKSFKILVGIALSFLTIFSLFSLSINLLLIEDSACDNGTFGFLDNDLNLFDCENESLSDINNDRSINLISGEGINVSEIFEEANNSVVGIGVIDDRVLDQSSQQIIGTGFVVSEDGLIATNQHVVSDPDAEYYIKFPNQNESFRVEEVYRDRINDIAIVKINAENLNPLEFGDPSAVTPGEVVVAIGNPLGELNSTVTSGIVSAVNRTVEIGSGSFLRTEMNRFEDTIQTDAAINPGNSGGPLINSNGQVIGINFATISGANNLSFAIPITYLENRLSELQEFGNFRIAYLGIGYEINSYIVNQDVVIGARILSVDPDGGATGVLREGDVVTEFNEVSIENESLFRLIQTSVIGSTAEVTFFRNGEQQSAEVRIEERE